MPTTNPHGEASAYTVAPRPHHDAVAVAFAGPLAAAWRDAGPLEELLAPPPDSLPVPSAQDRRVWTQLDAITLNDLGARAQADLGTSWPVPLPHEYARYFRDGHRDTYEQAVFARQRRLSRATVVAAVTLDPLWMDEVVDGVGLACEQSSWCWPAHDDTRAVHGAVLPTVADPFVDLGAGEVAAQLAYVDHLLGAALDEHAPGLRARVRYEVDARVLTPFERRRDWHWLGLDGDVHNWSAWIHGNILVAALRLIDAPDRRARLVRLAIEGIDRYVASLPDDGAIDEGYSYWWNGACRALEALDVLAHATGGVLSAAAVRALRETVAFPHRMHLGGDWFLNLADGRARACTHLPEARGEARPAPHQPWHALHRAALAVGDTQAEAFATAHCRPLAHEEHGLGRLLRALTDPAWVTASPADPPLPRETWFASTQVLIARTAAGSAAGLTLAVKGGHNGEHHNHNDVGSVVVALAGVPVLVDAGRPTYTAQTFGPDRYGIWTMQSSWHNVPEIRGTPQREGSAFGAQSVKATMDASGASLALDLAAAYPRDDLRSWRRTASLDRATNRVTVEDSWSLQGDSTEQTTVRWLVAGPVAVHPGAVEVLALDGAGALSLTWEPADAPCAVTIRELDDPMLNDVWGDRLTRLEIDVSALGPSGSLVVTVHEL